MFTAREQQAIQRTAIEQAKADKALARLEALAIVAAKKAA